MDRHRLGPLVADRIALAINVQVGRQRKRDEAKLLEQGKSEASPGEPGGRSLTVVRGLLGGELFPQGTKAVPRLSYGDIQPAIWR